MPKETYYFSHDYYARNDRKLLNLRLQLKMEGLGIFWCLVEMLYENEGKILISDIKSVAFEIKVKEKIVKSVILDFDLFDFDNEYFWSRSVISRLSARVDKSNKAKLSAESRWGKKTGTESDANALRAVGNRNAIKESKVKESKVSTTSTSASAIFLEDSSEKEKKENAPPAPPQPTQNHSAHLSPTAEMNSTDCLELFIVHAPLARTREAICYKNFNTPSSLDRPPIQLLYDWGKVFNEYLVEYRGDPLKTLEEYNKHFANWLKDVETHRLIPEDYQKDRDEKKKLAQTDKTKNNATTHRQGNNNSSHPTRTTNTSLNGEKF